MALTGMQIYKLLPQTNCKECGVPTCLSFAMKLAAGKAEIAACPYASEEAKAALGAAAEPPVQPLHIQELKRDVGNETVLFRHEKRFFDPTVLAPRLSDDLGPEEVQNRLQRYLDWSFERVGQVMRPEAFFLENTTGQAAPLLHLAQAVIEKAPRHAVLLWSEKPAVLREVTSQLSWEGRTPLLGPARPDVLDELRAVAEACNGALVVEAGSYDALIESTDKLRQAGFKRVLLSLGQDARDQLHQNTIVRRAALLKQIKTLGFPILNRVAGGQKAVSAACDAAVAICKYSSVLVLDEPSDAQLSCLLMLRQHIYTDPQKPIQVEAKIYELGEVTETSPVFVTANFSLTYFLVGGELETAGVPAYLAVVDTEGMGVLTAWAAGKFNGEGIGEFLRNTDLAQTLTKKRVVLPGYVANISGELEEALPDWEVLVGPQEAQDLPSFVKERLG